jgi:MraZ protein
VTFYGQSSHQLDPKGRLCLPKRIHALVGQDAEGERTVWLTRGRGGCLWLFTPAEFERCAASLPADPFGPAVVAAVAREFWASAFQTKLDGSNRVLLPDHLCDFAEIRPGTEVVVIGMPGRVELWSAAARKRTQLSAQAYEQGAAALANGGALAQEVQAIRQKVVHSQLEQQQLEAITRLEIMNPGALPADPTAEGGR